MYLLEKRSDSKVPIKIELSCSEIILGSGYIKALKNYPKVSKLHASLTNINGSWYIKDLSTHGVFLNFEKIGADPTKIEYWDVIGLGGSLISADVFVCILCPFDKDLAETAISNTIANHSEYKPSSKQSFFSNISEKDGSHSHTSSGCHRTEFKPALLVEKRSDGQTPIHIKLNSEEIILGSGYIKALKNYPKVSKLHASLTNINGSWYIKDLSTHGVFLNFEKIGADPTKIEYWDLIGLGESSISADVFTCVLCPYDENLAKSSINSNTINYSKDKVSSKTNLNSHVDEKNDANSCTPYTCFLHLERCDTDSFQSRNCKYLSHLKESEGNATSLQTNENMGTHLSNTFDVNNKVALYLRSIESNSAENDNLYVKDKTLDEDLQDDDAKSTTSSIESMDIIMYPSASVLSKIRKFQKDNLRKSKGKKDKHITSSNKSVIMHPSKSLSDTRKSEKQALKRPAEAVNMKVISRKEVEKKTVATLKKKSTVKYYFKT